MIDNFFCWLAYKLPRPLVKWAVARAMAHASAHYSDIEMGAISPAQVMNAWEKK